MNSVAKQKKNTGGAEPQMPVIVLMMELAGLIGDALEHIPNTTVRARCDEEIEKQMNKLFQALKDG